MVQTKSISKRLLAVMLSLAMVFSLVQGVSFTANAATTATSGDFKYELLADGTAKITDYFGTSGTLIIPEKIDRFTVTSIGDYAFDGCTAKSVVIPDSVTSIGDSAFRSCYSLTSVAIGNGVKSVGDWAFEHCNSLTSATIGNSVESIGDWAFYCCLKLTSVEIPDSVESIGDRAFDSCNSLTSVTIGNGVKSIGDYAFDSCKSLTSVTIGNSVTSIGAYAFNWCNSLTSIVLPDSVTSIGQYAFCDCDSLTSVVIPNSVTSIGNYAFAYCNSLTSATIGNSVKSIYSSTFYNCIAFTSVTIPNSVISIGSSAFGGCNLLSTVDFIGTKEQWDRIIFLDGNLFLTTATISFCQHTNTIIDEAVAPICDMFGLTEGRHCEACGTATMEQELLSPLGHIFTEYIYNDNATCIKDGTQTAICDREGCNIKHTEKVVGSALGHRTTVKNKKSATYFAKGYSGDTVCKTCNKTIARGKYIAKKNPTVKVTAGKKQIKVKYTKVSDATGFQVQYKIGKKTVTKTYSTKKSVTKIIKKLAKGTYKVKVRAFVKQGQINAYSSWTKTYTAKVK